MNPYVMLRLNATAVNSQQSMVVFGAPSLPGIAGFVHHLQRATGHEVISFMPIFHRVDHDAGHPKFRPFSGDMYRSYSEVTNPSTLDISTASVSVSLVLRLADRTLGEGCQDNFLPHCTNFCGGRIVSMPTGMYAETEDVLIDVLRRGRAGWLIRDRSDMFVGATDCIETLLDAVQRQKKISKQPKREEKREYLVPLHVGYLLIETPKQRPYMLRDPEQTYGHALAEPITSLGEYRFLHSELKDRTPFEGCWWSYAPVKPGDRICRLIST